MSPQEFYVSRNHKPHPPPSTPPLNIDMTIRDGAMGRLAREERQNLQKTIDILNSILRKVNADERVIIVKKRENDTAGDDKE